MKKLAVLGMGVCIVLAFSSCKSSESAYKKAYEKAKQQELAEPQTTTPVEEVAPVVSAPVEAKVVESAPVGTIREEKVTVVSGVDGLKDYSVVCGSFGVKANAENLKNFLDKEGYNAVIAFNADAAIFNPKNCDGIFPPLLYYNPLINVSIMSLTTFIKRLAAL